MSRLFTDSRQYSLHAKNLAINRFADILNDAGYASPIRRPRGRDILAACGQSKVESERKRKVEI
jgi:23S rRNA (adenine2503-C2)-methyltransferase